MVTGTMSATFWAIFLSVLAIALSGNFLSAPEIDGIESKFTLKLDEGMRVEFSWRTQRERRESDYEQALDRALKYAVIHDLVKPLDMREYRDDLRITKILHLPHYSRYVRKLHTSKPGKPVELRYAFQAVIDPEVPDLKKLLHCTAKINEFQLDHTFYYILTHRKNLKCEEDLESEELDEDTTENSLNLAHHVRKIHLRALPAVSHNTIRSQAVTMTTQRPSPAKVTIPKTEHPTTVMKEKLAAVGSGFFIGTQILSKQKESSIVYPNKKKVPEPKKNTEKQNDRIAKEPNKAKQPKNGAEAIKRPIMPSHESSTKSNTPHQTKHVPEPIKSIYKPNNGIPPESKKPNQLKYLLTPMKPNGKISYGKNLHDLNQIIERYLKRKTKTKLLAHTRALQPPKDKVLLFKLHEATVNVDLSGVPGQRFEDLLPLNSRNNWVLKNVVMNIKLGQKGDVMRHIMNAAVSNANYRNTKEQKHVLELPPPLQHKIKEQKNVSELASHLHHIVKEHKNVLEPKSTPQHKIKEHENVWEPKSPPHHKIKEHENVLEPKSPPQHIIKKHEKVLELKSPPPHKIQEHENVLELKSLQQHKIKENENMLEPKSPPQHKIKEHENVLELKSLPQHKIKEHKIDLELTSPSPGKIKEPKIVLELTTPPQHNIKENKNVLEPKSHPQYKTKEHKNVLDLKSPPHHEIKENDNVLKPSPLPHKIKENGIVMELKTSPQNKIKEPLHSIKDASIDLAEAGLGERIPEVLPQSAQSTKTAERSLLGRIKQTLWK